MKSLDKITPATFDPVLFDLFRDRCEKKTRFGKVFNVVVLLSCNLMKFSDSLKMLVLKIKSGAFLKDISSRPIVVSAEQKREPWQKKVTEISTKHNGSKILIVAELSIPQCKHYRVDQKVSILKKMGRKVTVISFTDIASCYREIPLVSMVIFYRTPLVEAVQGYIDECQRLGIPTVFDIDDLVFDIGEYQKHPVFNEMSLAEKDEFLNGGRLYQDCLSACDYGIASTRILADYMKRYTKGSVFTYENALGQANIDLVEKFIQRPKLLDITIGYGSGTTSHDEDFALIVPVLLNILDVFPNVRVVVHGYVDIGDTFDAYHDRVFQIPFLAADDYLRSIALFSINIVPLVKSIFNDAKSNIKYLEASLLAVPTVASPAAAFREVINHGVDGYLAETQEEWLAALTALIENEEARKDIGLNAKKKVMELYGSANMTNQLKGIVESVSCKSLLSKEKKKTLVVVNDLYAPYSFGGATIVAEQLVKHLSDRWEIVVVTCNTQQQSFDNSVLRYEHDGIPVYSITTKRHQKDPKDYRGKEVAEVFGRILENIRADVVHFHSIQTLGCDLLLSCKKLGIPTVLTLHDAWWLCERQFMIKSDNTFCSQQVIDLPQCARCTEDAANTYQHFFYFQDLLGSVDLLLAPSDFQRKFYKDNLSGNIAVKVNKNGILLPKSFNHHSRKADGKIRMAYLGGGAAPHKGYYYLQEIFKKIKNTNHELVIVDIHQHLGSTGIIKEEWELHGTLCVVPPFTASTIDNFYQDIDVLLFPSLGYESFGLTVREALARDVWVIANDIGGIQGEIKEGVNGNLLEVGDQDGFCRAIGKLLEMPDSLVDYVNIDKDEIRSFAEQADELDFYLNEVVSV